MCLSIFLIFNPAFGLQLSLINWVWELMSIVEGRICFAGLLVLNRRTIFRLIHGTTTRPLLLQPFMSVMLDNNYHYSGQATNIAGRHQSDHSRKRCHWRSASSDDDTSTDHTWIVQYEHTTVTTSTIIQHAELSYHVWWSATLVREAVNVQY